jgi:hypothetical protein
MATTKNKSLTQVVWMNGIQNIKFMSLKLIVIHLSG